MVGATSYHDRVAAMASGGTLAVCREQIEMAVQDLPILEWLPALSGLGRTQIGPMILTRGCLIVLH